MTPEQIDQHLDAVLRASGSALRNYSQEKPKADMRAAVRAIIAQARAEWVAELKPVGHAVYAYGTVGRLIVREDVADEYASKLRQNGADDVKVERLAIIPSTKEGS